MSVSTTNLLPTNILREASNLAYTGAQYLQPSRDYMTWDIAGMGETFKIPYFPRTSPSFFDDGTALSDTSYTPTSRSIVVRKVQKNSVPIKDSDAVINGDYIAKNLGTQIGRDDTTLPNDAVPVSARLNYTNFHGVIYDVEKLHVATSLGHDVIPIREDVKSLTHYCGRGIWGFNVSDLAGARAWVNES